MTTKNKSYLLLLLIIPVFAAILWVTLFSSSKEDVSEAKFWQIQSIDVMKYSRDLAREKLNDPTFDKTIEDQISRIAGTGASHVAIGVPYDAEFLPMLRRWVSVSRKYNLKVWFRGNFSGWEGWFDYKKIDQPTHTAMIKEFIQKNGDIFEDGDLFSSCPECENGGDGDPRQTGKVTEYRQFLVDETDAVRFAMRKIGRNVQTDLHSMNGDVAKLVMDKDTTKRLGGIVVIDHYVATADQLISDIRSLVESSGGKIILGEFGAPIPDIHGDMTEDQQAKWVQDVLYGLSNESSVIGLNYWTSFGGSTKLWNDDGSDRKAVGVMTNFFNPSQIKSQVVTWFGIPLPGVQVAYGRLTTITSKNGYFSFPVMKNSYVEVGKKGYEGYRFAIPLSQRIYLQPISLFSIF